MPLLLLRHATAGHRRPGDDADHLRPLDERGRRQAEALPEQYARFGVERMLTSPFVRCRQSVEPLADALGSRSRSGPSWPRGRRRRRRARSSASSAGATAVLCTHGDILGMAPRRGAGEGVDVGGRRSTTAASAASNTCRRRPSPSSALRASPPAPQADPALPHLHVVDLVDGDVHEPAPEQARAHEQEPGMAVSPPNRISSTRRCAPGP